MRRPRRRSEDGSMRRVGATRSDALPDPTDLGASNGTVCDIEHHACSESSRTRRLLQAPSLLGSIPDRVDRRQTGSGASSTRTPGSSSRRARTSDRWSAAAVSVPPATLADTGGADPVALATRRRLRPARWAEPPFVAPATHARGPALTPTSVGPGAAAEDRHGAKIRRGGRRLSLAARRWRRRPGDHRRPRSASRPARPPRSIQRHHTSTTHGTVTAGTP